MTQMVNKLKFKDTFEKIYNSAWTIWIILSFGILIRVFQYISNHSLWLDDLTGYKITGLKDSQREK